MAAIDKMNEFYWRFPRFAFLASAYQPDDLPEPIKAALDVIAGYYHNTPEFQRQCEDKAAEIERWEEDRAYKLKIKAIGVLLQEDAIDYL